MVDDAMAEVLRRKTDEERLAITLSLWRRARDLIRADVRAAHPDWDEDQVNRAVAWRMSHGLV
jgi:hypothetical protein